MAKVLAITNQKGGVGKTTTAYNVAAALASLHARRVLLVDCDSQCNATRNFGKNPEALAGLSEIFGDEPRPIAELIEQTETAGLSLVPGPSEGLDRDLYNQVFQASMGSGKDPRFVFADEIASLNTSYDTIILDAPPSLGIILLATLIAADSYLVPMYAEGMSVQGLRSMVQTAELLTKSAHERQPALNPHLRMAGILITRMEPRPQLTGQIIGLITETFGADLVLATKVRKNVDLAAAASMGQTIYEYAPGSNGAADYSAVTAELLARGVV